MSSSGPSKIVFIGESKVGKSSILLQYIEGAFNPEMPTSLTAQFYRKDVKLPDNNSLTFDLWDTAGLEKYRSLAKLFFKEASAVVLVYDSTNEKSFKELKEFWYNEVKNLKIILAVVANKCDLNEKKVTDEEGKEFADNIGAIFESVSAKENIGINSLLGKIGEAIKNKK